MDVSVSREPDHDEIFHIGLNQTRDAIGERATSGTTKAVERVS